MAVRRRPGARCAGLVLLALAGGGGPAARAAPLPWLPPHDVCGRVFDATWTPAQRRDAVPGASGSLGVDRAVAAHFRVVLAAYSGIDRATAAQLNGFVFFDAGPRPDRVALQLDSDDPRLLDGVRTLCVRGYHVSGDEGSTWTRYVRLQRNPAPRR
jgi:hypothetical protein